MELHPTDEQEAIVEFFGTGQDLVIEALAGTGKTSTMRMIGHADAGLFGIYLVFNSEVAAEAQAKFPPRVKCATGHAVAMQQKGKDYRHRLDAGRVTSKQVAEALGIRRWINLRDPKVKGISPWRVASMATQTVLRYCHSDDEEIGPKHVPYVRGAKGSEIDEIQAIVVPYARQVWADVSSIEGRFRFEHDHYFKMWALGRPQLGYDYVILDEAQDTNPALAGVVRAQEDTQIVMVGDSRQQLFEWRGASDAMSDFPDATRLALTQSFRFGDAVAEEANRWLEYLDEPLRVAGLPTIDSTLGPIDRPDAILCRTNADVVENVMALLERDFKVGIAGKKVVESIDSFARAAGELKADGKTSHHELSIFKSWPDVMTYVSEEAPDGSFGTFVRLIDRYGHDRIRQVMAQCTPHNEAEVVVSTVHKVKGLEWGKVQLDGGLLEEGPEQSRPSMMLNYVAVTRAKFELDVGSLELYHRRRRQTQKLAGGTWHGTGRAEDFVANTDV